MKAWLGWLGASSILYQGDVSPCSLPRAEAELFLTGPSPKAEAKQSDFAISDRGSAGYFSMLQIGRVHTCALFRGRIFVYSTVGHETRSSERFVMGKVKVPPISVLWAMVTCSTHVASGAKNTAFGITSLGFTAT